MVNAIGREIPEYIDGYGKTIPFAGAFVALPQMQRHAPAVKAIRPGESKLVKDLEEVFRRISIRNGMTLSFHHHFRNGDGVVNLVLGTAARLGLKDLKVALSAVFPVHAPLVDLARAGVISGLDTNYISGPVAKGVSAGIFPKPVILRTHGGRARAIECGQLPIDVAFIAAPAADDYGNINGVTGPAACGSLGYAFPDAEYADHVVAVTDHVVKYPLSPISIPQTRVDYVVKVDRIGDPKGIVSGTTKITDNPAHLKIAEMAARAIQAAGLIRGGFSFQTGAGGPSLATALFVRRMMEERRTVGSFLLGGITGYMVEMLEQGLFSKIIDVQGFDLKAVRSLANNGNHIEVGAGFYANPFNAGCTVNRLDCVVVGATEIDADFNVNVVTGSDGIIMGGSGGHSDTAAGAKLTVVVANLVRGPYPTVVDKVVTVATPGETVDVLVTEQGVAVNPLHSDLAGLLIAAGLPVKEIDELKIMAERTAGPRRPSAADGRTVAAVEYRDGTIIDVVRQVAG
jgi:citrate lyase subunit alpha / citrate CoA-transferase